MSMYKQFKTDTNLEKSGIDLDYGDFRVRIARAGGSNKRFSRILEAKMKPVRRALQTETLDNERAEILMRESYAEGVVLEWSVRVLADEAGSPVEPLQLAGAYRESEGRDPEHSVFIKGIEGPDGDILPFTTDNVVATFKALPDLFSDVREQAGKIGLFREQGQEADAGN